MIGSQRMPTLGGTGCPWLKIVPRLRFFEVGRVLSVIPQPTRQEPLWGSFTLKDRMRCGLRPARPAYPSPGLLDILITLG
jgi:hypothetical protein